MLGLSLGLEEVVLWMRLVLLEGRKKLLYYFYRSDCIINYGIEYLIWQTEIIQN